MKYSVIGLGKLGASMAASIASRGFDVIGVDVNVRTVALVNDGHAPVQETDLEQLIAANRHRLRATTNHRDAILGSDITFVIVPTPSDERGAFSLQYARWAFREIGSALAAKNSHHLVVMTSTVLPGSTRHGLLPVLEQESGKKCGVDFGLCYSPEFIALGSVIHDFLYPDFTLVGEYDDHSGDILESAYTEIMPLQTPCQRMSLENAELAKVSLNAFVTTKITFANMLADICERLPGGDIDIVTNAIGLDRRIGHRYLKGALGYGGPCFPRDNIALGFMARALGTRATLSETTDEMNRSLAERAMQRVRHIIKRGTTVAVLGLAYKPNSHVIEESQGIFIARTLLNAGVRVLAYDPLAGPAANMEFQGKVLIMDSVTACLETADIVLITTPDPEFKKLKASDFRKRQAVVTVIDYWRILSDELSNQPGINYDPYGRSIDDANNNARLSQLWTDQPAE